MCFSNKRAFSALREGDYTVKRESPKWGDMRKASSYGRQFNRGTKGVATMKIRVKVDRSACIGAAECTLIAPHIFSLDAENKAVVNEEAAAQADEALLWEVADSCPALAIILYDENGDQVYPQ
ncbi:MAG: ferredoxin [Ardenticatenia bacterium]|nr:MAG: ferredoxin [Ardenticatenia bacterium]